MRLRQHFFFDPRRYIHTPSPAAGEDDLPQIEAERALIAWPQSHQCGGQSEPTRNGGYTEMEVALVIRDVPFLFFFWLSCH